MADEDTQLIEGSKNSEPEDGWPAVTRPQTDRTFLLWVWRETQRQWLWRVQRERIPDENRWLAWAGFRTSSAPHIAAAESVGQTGWHHGDPPWLDTKPPATERTIWTQMPWEEPAIDSSDSGGDWAETDPPWAEMKAELLRLFPEVPELLKRGRLSVDERGEVSWYRDAEDVLAHRARLHGCMRYLLALASDCAADLAAGERPNLAVGQVDRKTARHLNDLMIQLRRVLRTRLAGRGQLDSIRGAADFWWRQQNARPHVWMAQLEDAMRELVDVDFSSVPLEATKSYAGAIVRRLAENAVDAPPVFSRPTDRQLREVAAYLKSIKIVGGKAGRTAVSPWGAAAGFAECFGLPMPRKLSNAARGRKGR